MSTAIKNGPPRKQLSEQIDRLDGVIDALDEGLKGAVSDAVREAVGAAVNEAVQAVLLELMTNAELQKAVRQVSAPAEPPAEKEEQENQQPKPSGSLLSRAWGRVRSAARSCAGGLKQTFRAARLAWSLAGDRIKALVLAAAACAAGAAYAARSKVAAAVRAALGAGKELIEKAGRCLGRLAPALTG
jgi:hypothetical protein